MEYALKLKGVTKRYERFVLENIQLILPKGTIMGFVGENGAGKTTTIKAMLGLISIDAGEIELLGRSVTAEDVQLHQQVGVVLDENHFHELLTPREVNIVLKDLFENWDETYYFALLKKLGLPNTQKIKEFSRGMKMKLSLAAAMAHHPKLLLLDEPTGGLDPVVRAQVLDLLLDFIQDEEHSVFLSSHITSDLEKICDYIVFIQHGKLVLCEQKDELLYGYGIARCTEEQFAVIRREEYVASRKAGGHRELFIKDKAAFEKAHSECVTDALHIDEMLLFGMEGEEV